MEEDYYSNAHGAAGLPNQLPEYQCHKKVWAFKIFNILERKGEDGYVYYVLSDGASAVIYVSKEYVEKHNPKVGGYYVRYQDGYESYSPAGAFENGYSLITDESQVSSHASSSQEVTISKKEYFNLLKRDLELASLEQAGVDNWEWYSESKDDLDKMILELSEGEFKTFMKQEFDL